MRYLGIDPGAFCGWAVLEADGSYHTGGMWQIPPDPRGDGARLARLAGLMKEAMERFEVGVVVVEKPAMLQQSLDASMLAGEFYGLICYATYVLKRELRSTYPVTVKKVATGKGSAPKLDMILSANQRWGLGITYRQTDRLDKRKRPIYTFPGHGDAIADAAWIAETGRQGLLT